MIKDINPYNSLFFMMFIIFLFCGLYGYEHVALVISVDVSYGYLLSWYFAIISAFLTILATPSARKQKEKNG